MSKANLVSYELLLAGYFRRIEEILNSDIPKEIRKIIILYQKMLCIFGIGSPGSMFGSQEKELKQFTLLTNFQSLLPNVNTIFRNNKSFMVITQNNDLYAAGKNSYYRLGLQQDSDLNKFTKIMDNVKLTSTGCENDTHTFIYTLDHKLYASGNNYSGNFGNNHKTNSFNVSHKLEAIDTNFLQNKTEHITKIELGPSFSLFLSNHGYVYSCGASGAHGHDEYSLVIPTLINTNNDNEPIIDIGCGYYHALALDKKHRLIGWGDNDYGQIATTEWNRENQLPAFHQYFTENKIKVKSIYVGYCHNLCIDMDGNGYLFGRNDSGQIGNGETIHRDKGGVRIPFNISDCINDAIIDGSCGDDFTVLLTKSNNLVAFGNNAANQFCSREEEEILKPYTLSKRDELGIPEDMHIEKVIAVNYATVIFVDPFKNLN